MYNLLLFSLYYSSTDSVTAFMGFISVLLLGIYCCSSVTGDDQSSKDSSHDKISKGSYSPGSYYSGSYSPGSYSSNRIYDDEEINYNWDDSWDDKWLHQGEYADVVDTPSEEYTDYDPSWDEQFRD